MYLAAAATPTVVGRDDGLQVGMRLHQRRGLVGRLGRVVVAVDGVDELQLRVVGGQIGLHQLDPRVLVLGGRGGRQDRDLATLGADRVRGPLVLRRGDQLGRGRLDHRQAGRRVVDVGVVGDDGDAGRLGLLEEGRHRVGVGGRDDDRVDALLDGRVDELGLRRSGRLGRADLLALGAQLAARLLGADECRVEVRVVDRLRDDGDLHAGLQRRGGRGGRGRGVGRGGGSRRGGIGGRRGRRGVVVARSARAHHEGGDGGHGEDLELALHWCSPELLDGKRRCEMPQRRAWGRSTG